jgi:hypothetical protein
MATDQQRSLKMGRTLLWSTIKNQAGFSAAVSTLTLTRKNAVDKPDKHTIRCSDHLGLLQTQSF